MSHCHWSACPHGEECIHAVYRVNQTRYLLQYIEDEEKFAAVDHSNKGSLYPVSIWNAHNFYSKRNAEEYMTLYGAKVRFVEVIFTAELLGSRLTGRTEDFESSNLGSNPNSPAKVRNI